MLVGETGHSVRDLIREVCRRGDIEILEGHVRPDHVHLLLSAPPRLAPSRVMQAIKGKTSPAPVRGAVGCLSRLASQGYHWSGRSKRC